MNRSRGGFTVVELMVAMTIGGIAISSIYTIGAASTRHFREQQRVSTTQSSVRAAMTQIKRDFQRAGFLGTPSASQLGESCGATPAGIDDPSRTPGTGRLAAVSAYFRNVNPGTAMDPGGLNQPWATVDDVTLMANYATSGEYMGITVASNELDVIVPITSQSFTRDFTNWYAAGGRVAGTCDQNALQAAFPPGRLVRVHALNDVHSFGVVRTATCANAATPAVITLNNALDSRCNHSGGWISPLNTIRYHVENAAVDEASRIGANRVAVLRRTEVEPVNKRNPLMVNQDGTPRRMDDRAVLDYVVRFSVDFLTRDNTVTGLDYVPAPQLAVQDNPERVRGVIIEIAARTSEHEPEMSITNQLIPPFVVLDTAGAARTRALRAELLLPNIALEGY